MSDSKAIMIETIGDKQWPRLTEETNRTQIDFSRGYSIDIERLDFYDASTLRIVGANLGFDTTDYKAMKEAIKQIPEDLSTYMNKYSKMISGSNILTTKMDIDDEDVRFYSFSTGTALLETRDNKGNLKRRYLYREGGAGFKESYTPTYTLESKSTRDENGRFVGPRYEGAGEGGVITYHLHGHRVSKQEWLSYVEKSKRLVKDIPSMVSDVGALISSYTTF